MTLYSVFEPPADTGTNRPPVAVADRFSWFAFLLPPVYMIVQRLWVALAAYALFLVAVFALGAWAGRGSASLVYLLFAVWIGLEAAGFRRAALRRRRFTDAGDVVAAERDLAELELLRLREQAP